MVSKVQNIPPRMAPCAHYACRRGGSWLVFTPHGERLHACGVHLADVITTTGARHAAVEVVTNAHRIDLGHAS